MADEAMTGSAPAIPPAVTSMPAEAVPAPMVIVSSRIVGEASLMVRITVAPATGMLAPCLKARWRTVPL